MTGIDPVEKTPLRRVRVVYEPSRFEGLYGLWVAYLEPPGARFCLMMDRELNPVMDFLSRYFEGRTNVWPARKGDLFLRFQTDKERESHDQ